VEIITLGVVQEMLRFLPVPMIVIIGHHITLEKVVNLLQRDMCIMGMWGSDEGVIFGIGR